MASCFSDEDGSAVSKGTESIPEVHFAMNVPETDARRARAVFRHAGNVLGIRFKEAGNAGEAQVIYGGAVPPNARVFIPESPCLELPQDFRCRRESGITIFPLDILEFLYRCLFREEEAKAPRDQWGCFRAEHSFLSPRISEPLADHAVRSLGRALSGAGVPVQNRIWPGGAKLAVSLSHDVDVLRIQNFERYCSLERSLGFRSGFYLVPQSNGHPVNPKYRLSEPGLLPLLRRLSEEDWEIGCHLSYGSHLDGGRIRLEKEFLEQWLGKPVLGGRCHFLPFEVNATPFLQAEAGYLYDTTLGFNEAIGFRSGTSFPHRFVHPSGELAGPLELPLHIMDGALFWDMKLSPDQALEEMIRTTERVEEVGGCLNVLWHLRVLNNPEYGGWGEVYESYLRWLKQKRAWVTSPSAVATWWLVRENSISMSGQGGN